MLNPERNTGLLVRPGKAEVPKLGVFRIHEKSETVVVREGVVLGTGFWRAGLVRAIVQSPSRLNRGDLYGFQRGEPHEKVIYQAPD